MPLGISISSPRSPGLRHFQNKSGSFLSNKTINQYNITKVVFLMTDYQKF